MGVLREAIHHRQNHRLAVHLWKTLDEVHGDISPHLGQDVQGLKQADRLSGRRLVSLAHVAGADEVMHQLAIAGDVEIASEAHKGFLDPLMPSRVCKGHHLVTQVVDGRNIDALAVEEETIPGCPRRV